MRESAYITVLGASLLVIVLVDALKLHMNHIDNKLHIILDVVLILWLPSSVVMSVWLLVTHQQKPLLSPPCLPLWTQRSNIGLVSQSRADNLENFVILLAFGHALLILSRFLGAMSGGSAAYSSDSSSPDLTCSSNSPNQGCFWVPVGLPMSVISVVVFGKCLLMLGVEENHWGYFLLPYRVITTLIELVVYTLQSFIDLFEAGRIAIEVFRKKWGNAT